MAHERGAGLDRQVVRMPDGRQLIYYRFASTTPAPEPGPPAPKPSRKKPNKKG